MNPRLSQLLVRWLILALGVTLATHLVTGIRCDDLGTLISVVLLLSLFNAVLRPVLVLFTLPFIVVTMGLGIVAINALLFMLVGKIVGPGFHVDGFWSAFWGSVVVSCTNFVAGAVLRNPRPPRSGPPGPGATGGFGGAGGPAGPSGRVQPPASAGDVIDI